MSNSDMHGCPENNKTLVTQIFSHPSFLLGFHKKYEAEVIRKINKNKNQNDDTSWKVIVNHNGQQPLKQDRYERKTRPIVRSEPLFN